MHAHTVAWLRRKAATDVSDSRRELIALSRQSLKPEVEMHEKHRIVSAIIAVYDEARRLIRIETAAAAEEAVAHRPQARRAAGAAGDPVRADATFRVAEHLGPVDLLRLANKAIADDDVPGQWGIFNACLAHVEDPAYKGVFSALNAPPRDEAAFASSYLLCREEGVWLGADEGQARVAAPQGLQAGFLGSVYEARFLDLGPLDQVTATEGDVKAARLALNVPFAAAQFEVAAPEPVDAHV